MRAVLLVLLTGLILVHPFSSAAVPQSNDPLILNLTVTNKKGTIIRGLTLENFSITVDKQPLKILSLNELEVPSSIGILIDSSGSQHTGGLGAGVEIKQQFRQGLERFFKLNNPANEYFALTFHTKTELLHVPVDEPRDFTDEHGLVYLCSFVKSVAKSFQSLTRVLATRICLLTSLTR